MIMEVRKTIMTTQAAVQYGVEAKVNTFVQKGEMEKARDRTRRSDHDYADAQGFCRIQSSVVCYIIPSINVQT